MSLTSYVGCHLSMEEKGSEGMSIEGEIFVGPTYADVGEKAEVKINSIDICMFFIYNGHR